jgi:hypothetical protein
VKAVQALCAAAAVASLFLKIAAPPVWHRTTSLLRLQHYVPGLVLTRANSCPLPSLVVAAASAAGDSRATATGVRSAIVISGMRLAAQDPGLLAIGLSFGSGGTRRSEGEAHRN